MSARNAALRAVYDTVRDRLDYGVSFAMFKTAYRGWSVVPLRHGEIVGAVFVKGNEIHYGAARPFFIRRYVRGTLARLIDQFGCAITRVPRENSAGLKFCERLGFHEMSEKNGIVYLKCEGTPYA